MKIYADRMIKEIVDDEIKYKKYNLSWETKKIYDSLLPDIYYKYSINAENIKANSTQYYTIDEIIDEYIHGKRYFDIYYKDDEKNRENYVLDKAYDSPRIYKQIADIFKTPSKKFIGAKIKKCDIDNILILLKYYQHPVDKKIRTNSLTQLKFEDFKEYVELIKKERQNIDKENEEQLEYLLERTFNTKLYSHMGNTIHYLKEIMISDLSMLSNIDDINLRLEYVNLYKKLFNEFTTKWREEVDIINNINNEVVKEMNVCNIDSILNDESLEVSLEGKYKSIDNYKHIFDVKNLKEEFSKQTFKEMMTSIQESNKKIKNSNENKS